MKLHPRFDHAWVTISWVLFMREQKKIVKSCTLKVRGGAERDCYGKRAGKGALVQWEKAGTLGVSQDQTLIVWKEA